ncbi:hypothetical protein JDV02_005624 [Purpureocillium takamizusanense]|uniref:Uncharacterized protein n=1 Tax=Purpureocillium takamizusanense TaxID=2060973 RepID=A0A9Q8QGZ2_9HYPO|nr:uncharacterized protein JDV02_005624 [Purpureocillium takamizusanense]UNI19440.1 hypothetical protein JDV02_005624 [Purpureocillium takamizusanense]
MNLKTVLVGALPLGLLPAAAAAAQTHKISKYGWFGSSSAVEHAQQVKAIVSDASIDLSQPFDAFTIPSTLYEKLGPYTFAFDATNRRLFFSVPNTELPSLGYNCLIGFDLSKPAGSSSSSYEEMYLYGFGPGNVSFAAVPEGNDTRLWFDVDPDPTTGRATALAGFLWLPRIRLYNPSTGLVKASPVAGGGADDYSSTYDPATDSLVVRYRLGNQTRITAYDPVRASKKDFSAPKYDVQFASRALNTAKSKTVRGWAVLAQNLYVLTGDSASTFADTNAEIVNVDIRTGRTTQGPVGAQVNKLGSGLYDALPQGLGVRYKKGEYHQLLFGVAARTSSHRQANLFSGSKVLG